MCNFSTYLEISAAVKANINIQCFHIPVFVYSLAQMKC